MHISYLRTALANAFQIPTKSLSNAKSTIHNATPCVNTRPSRAQFSTSSSRLAKKSKGAKPDKRITLIRYHLYHPTTLMPRPLRFSRNRHLRHWTIHRAWQLYRHKQKKARQLELERQYNAMNAACEELRIGAGDGGRLFRKSMMKTGVWSIPERGGGVPIEYARGMMEWVGGPGVGAGGGTAAGKSRIWDSEWKRA